MLSIKVKLASSSKVGNHQLSYLTQDEQQFLGSAQGEYRDQTAALSVDNVVDGITEPSLALLSLLVNMGTVRGLLTKEDFNYVTMI